MSDTELRDLRETNARLNRRVQIAESAINELVTGTGGGKLRPIVREMWERCEAIHEHHCRRAEAAEAELRELRDRLIGLSEVWSQYPGPALSCATDVRALLDTPVPTPGHCTCGQPGCSDGGE